MRRIKDWSIMVSILGSPYSHGNYHIDPCSSRSFLVYLQVSQDGSTRDMGTLRRLYRCPLTRIMQKQCSETPILN